MNSSPSSDERHDSGETLWPQQSAGTATASMFTDGERIFTDAEHIFTDAEHTFNNGKHKYGQAFPKDCNAAAATLRRRETGILKSGICKYPRCLRSKGGKSLSLYPLSMNKNKNYVSLTCRCSEQH